MLRGNTFFPLKDLENELEEKQTELEEKTKELGSSETRITNVCKFFAHLWWHSIILNDGEWNCRNNVTLQHQTQLALSVLAAQIMDLHQKIKQLKTQIDNLKESNAATIEGKEFYETSWEVEREKKNAV